MKKKNVSPLEALQQIKATICVKGGISGYELAYIDVIEKALKDYEEGLENAKTYVKHTSKQALYDLLGLALKNVHRSYWKLPEQLYNDVSKSLEALEIIKENEVNVFIFLHSGDLETYNDMVEDSRKLSKEEYDLLKEVLL